MKKFNLLFLTAIIVSNPIFAGGVDLINEDWDFIAVVEVKRSDNNLKIEKFTGVRRGIVTRDSSKICYRRSSNPRDENSTLTEWSCAQNTLESTPVEKFTLR